MLLALACFIPPDMEWMMNAMRTELRLIDLEECGPPIMFWDSITWNNQIEGYLECVKMNACRCYKSAFSVESDFCSGLTKLVKADLVDIVSFTGHSCAAEVTEKAAFFLKPAQKLLSYFSCAFGL